MDVDDVPVLDLKEYIENYSGHGKVSRLLFVARVEQPELRNEALQMAMHELRHHSVNVEAYSTLCNRMNVERDEEWVQKVCTVTSCTVMPRPLLHCSGTPTTCDLP
jgi:hypothetical protein